MAISALSLPTDIPWKRLCVSEDMIDKTIGDRKFPYRWRSSVAVFSYEPPEDQQSYEGMIVSYLKVACTITSFQPNPEEVGIKDRKVNTYWNTPALIEDYVNKVSKAYPCYGAILEVGVAPSEMSSKIPLSKYPYFMDFEPKKRELYELVSQTGEKMSRSLEDVNVRKGTTTASSHEVLDETNYKATAGAAIGGIGISGSVESKSGTKDINSQQFEDVRTTDSAREARENFSQTTQLTQMYQQLNSYHLGTNRAVFFLLPRPRIVEDEKIKLTFINGPRQLEGIQEFFLVVMRPKEIKDICVEAYLETAHVGDLPTYVNDFVYRTDTTQNLFVRAVSEEETKYQSKSITYSVPPGWEIDISNNGGYKINIIEEQGRDYCKVTEIDKNHLVLSGKVHTEVFYITNWKGAVTGTNYAPGILRANATVYLRQNVRKQTGSSNSLYITGRGVCSCINEDFVDLFKESVVWEKLMPSTFKEPVGDIARISVSDANHLRAEIGSMMVQSINHPDRYKRGTVSFAETQLVAHSIASLISTPGHQDDHGLEEIEGLQVNIKDRISARATKISRSALLMMSPAEQRDRFDLNQDEILHLRRAIIGLEGPLPDPQYSWDYRSKITRIKVNVPDIVGLSLEEVGNMFRPEYLRVGDVTYQDSEKPKDTVLAQNPDAGAEVTAGAKVDIVVASGAVVRIPDVVHKSLSQALIMLHEAGLESEPDICFVPTEDHPKNLVLEVTPASRTYITPKASVELKISGGASEQAGICMDKSSNC